MMDACYCGRAKEGSRYVIEPFSGDQRQMGSEVSRVERKYISSGAWNIET